WTLRLQHELVAFRPGCACDEALSKAESLRRKRCIYHYRSPVYVCGSAAQVPYTSGSDTCCVLPSGVLGLFSSLAYL
ncbi:hypothetical protein HPB47_008732, partial [Ixodes persulcatus]